MISLETSLVELKSQRAQLEIQLLGIRRRIGDLDEERSRERAAEIQRLEGQIDKIDRRITRAESGDVEGTVQDIALASLQVSAELDQTRSRVLDTLRSLAEPLRLYAELAERQRALTACLREATGKDNSYAAYIDMALLRTSDCDEEIEFVLELLKRTRPVA